MEVLQQKVLEYLKKSNKRIEFDTLKKKLGIHRDEDARILEDTLKKLEERGFIYLDNKGFYQVFDQNKLNKVHGKIKICKDGIGYVTPLDEENNKYVYLVHKACLNGALNGDIVILSDFNEQKGKIIASVEKIVKRNEKKVIFEYCGEGLFLPYNQKRNVAFKISDDEIDDYVSGEIVLVDLAEKEYEKIKNKFIYGGKVIKKLGHKDDPKTDNKIIAYNYGFPLEFSKKSLEELEYIPTKISETDLEGRRDLRNETIFTIDGDHTKDIDDAVSIKKEENFYILTVHIADVSNYIKPNMALYEEAKMRGTSLYLVDSVIPMLPHKISNGICSLNPGVDRLAISVEMKINEKGDLIDYDIFKSVINSKKQMTYNAVNSILEYEEIPNGYRSFISDICLLNELSHILEEKKKRRGSIDFASREIEIGVGHYGEPIYLEPREQKAGEKIIENCMLMTNETVAMHVNYMNLPFVYRIHEHPNIAEFEKVLDVLKTQNIISSKKINRLFSKLEDDRLDSYDVANLLDELKGTPYYISFSEQILKSMSKARYSKNNEGHYCLALRNYMHFTSPIRRFPDLKAHELLSEYMTFQNMNVIETAEKELPEICDHSSFMEREAEAAEREADKLKVAEYMKNHSDEIFEGTVLSCNRYGVTVVLDNGARGTGHIEDILDGNYYYDSQNHRLVNKEDKKEYYQIGDRIITSVKEVSIPYKTISFYCSKMIINQVEKPKVRRIHKINFN